MAYCRYCGVKLLAGFNQCKFCHAKKANGRLNNISIGYHCRTCGVRLPTGKYKYCEKCAKKWRLYEN